MISTQGVLLSTMVGFDESPSSWNPTLSLLRSGHPGPSTSPEAASLKVPQVEGTELPPFDLGIHGATVNQPKHVLLFKEQLDNHAGGLY